MMDNQEARQHVMLGRKIRARSTDYTLNFKAIRMTYIMHALRYAAELLS